MNVLKRNGSTEELNVEKINNVVNWACKGYDANPSDVLMNAKIQLFDGIKTTKIHEVLVNSAIELKDLSFTLSTYNNAHILTSFLFSILFSILLYILGNGKLI